MVRRYSSGYEKSSYLKKRLELDWLFSLIKLVVLVDRVKGKINT